MKGYVTRCSMVAAVLLVVTCMVMPAVTSAQEQPPGCAGNFAGLDINCEPNLNLNGDIITCDVFVTNDAPGCDIDQLRCDFVCPDGTGAPAGALENIVTNGFLPQDGSGDISFSGDCTLALNPGVTVAAPRAYCGDITNPVPIDLTVGRLLTDPPVAFKLDKLDPVTIKICGDSIVGNQGFCTEDGSTCDADADCLETCRFETCDPPGLPSGEPDECREDCTFCGDGILDEAWMEECDDGNNVDGDGCSADCLIEEYCGDGVLNQPFETCDPPGSLVPPIFGDLDDDRTCRNTSEEYPACTYCGDGIVDTIAGEACDDGNSNDNDACNNECQPNDCDVEIIKETSCDGGITWGDGCTTLDGNDVEVRYTYSNEAAADLFDCVINDSNPGFSGVSTPFDLPFGGSGMAGGGEGLCSALEGDEPDTAQIICECYEDGGQTVQDQDDSDFSCVDCDVEIEKEVSCDGGATWVEDCAVLGGGEVQVRYSYVGTGDASIASCTVGDTNPNIDSWSDTLGPFTLPASPDVLTGEICSDLQPELYEPDTATLNCECVDPAGVQNKPVSDTNDTDFACLECDVDLQKEVSCDGGPWMNDCTADPGGSIEVRYTVTNNSNMGTNFTSCGITDSNTGIIPGPPIGPIDAGNAEEMLVAPLVCDAELVAGEPDTGTVSCECADDAGNTTTVGDTDTANFDCPSVLEICRTPGFWKTHGGIGQVLIDFAGDVEVCGQPITTALQYETEESSLEAMCVNSDQNEYIKQNVLQGGRQLMAAVFNCILSGGGADCSGMGSFIGDYWGLCNYGCTLDNDSPMNEGDWPVGTCSDNGMYCTESDLSNCGNPATATCDDLIGRSECYAAIDCFNNQGRYAQGIGCYYGACELQYESSDVLCSGSSDCADANVCDTDSDTCTLTGADCSVEPCAQIDLGECLAYDPNCVTNLCNPDIGLCFQATGGQCDTGTWVSCGKKQDYQRTQSECNTNKVGGEKSNANSSDCTIYQPTLCDGALPPLP